MAALTTRSFARSGLVSKPARRALLVALAVGIAYGLQSDLVPGGLAGAIVYGLLLAGVLIVTSHGPGALPYRQAALLLAISFGAMSLTLALAAGPRELWPYTFAFYLIMLLVPRGRAALSLGASLAYLVISLSWAEARGLGPGDTAYMLTLPTLASLASWVWFWANGYFGRREMIARTEIEVSRLRTAAEEEAEGEYRAEMERIARMAVPSLALIASGAPLDDDSRREIRVAEGQVRDHIRAPGLCHPALVRSVAEARRRGVRVLLLGGTDRDTGLAEAVAARLCGLVDGVRTGSITIRKAPPGRAEAYSALIETPAGVHRVTLDAAGLEHGADEPAGPRDALGPAGG